MNQSELSLVSIYDILLFFACGVGSSLCYIATLSSLVYFKYEYGPDSYVYLNFATYLPLLPISLAQARWDQQCDIFLGSYGTFLFRGILGFVVSIVATALIPVLVIDIDTSPQYFNSLSSLIVLTASQGTAGAILQGTFNQLASFVPADGGSLKASVSSGLQASVLLVLAVSIITGFGSSGSAYGFQEFFLIIAGIEFMLFILFLTLMCRRHLIKVSMSRRDSSFVDRVALLSEENYDEVSSEDPDFRGLSEEVEPNGYNNIAEEDEVERYEQDLQPLPHQQLQQLPTDLTYGQLWDVTKLCCYTLILTLISSFLVGSWFTQVQTNLAFLPQLLFYVRIGSDFLGRIATIAILKPVSVRCIFISSILRLILVLLFFVNASSKTTTGEEEKDTTLFSKVLYSDAITVLLASIIAFSSGYQVTGCFQLAPSLLTMEQRDRNVAKQTGLLNVAFSIAAFTGISLSMILVTIGL